MPIDRGNTDCTTGLSKLVYDNWTGDARSGLVKPLTGAAQNSVRALCYAVASAVADAVNQLLEPT